MSGRQAPITVGAHATLEEIGWGGSPVPASPTPAGSAPAATAAAPSPAGGR
jgi:hypothetical protein